MYVTPAGSPGVAVLRDNLCESKVDYLSSVGFDQPQPEPSQFQSWAGPTLSRWRTVVWCVARLQTVGTAKTLVGFGFGSKPKPNPKPTEVLRQRYGLHPMDVHSSTNSQRLASRHSLARRWKALLLERAEAWLSNAVSMNAWKQGSGQRLVRASLLASAALSCAALFGK